MKNTWHDDQPKTRQNRFKPLWNDQTILWIIEEVNKMTDFIDIQYQLVKDYGISLAAAAMWIEMSRRIMKDMANGLSLEESITRDRDRRNEHRRMNKELKRKHLTQQQVNEIREKSKDPNRTQASIADEYGIGQSTVSSIVNGNRWPQIS